MRKRFCSIILAAAMIMTMIPFAMAADPSGFDDVSGHWAESSIERWSGYGVVGGAGDGTFAPDGVLTRAQAAQIFANLLGLTTMADIGQYGDVAVGSWYYDAIAKCVAAGILTGDGAGAMSPEAVVSREQLFVMFARAMGIEPKASSDTAFADSGEVSSWAAGYINALADMGAIQGSGDGTLNPSGDMNRASFVAVLDQTISGYANTDGATVGGTQGIVLVVAENVTVVGNVENLVIAGGSAGISGSTVENITVSGDNASVSVGGSAVVGQVNVTGANASVAVSGQASVAHVTVADTAVNAGVAVDGDAAVSVVDSAASNVTISGTGTVETANVSGDNTTVNTDGTDLTVSQGTTGVTENNKPVSGGASVETQPEAPQPSNPVNPPVYIPTYYTVNFVGTDGVALGSQTVVENTTGVTAPEVVLEEGQQVKWHNGTDYVDLSAVTVSSDVTLTAVVGSDDFAAGNGTEIYPYLISNVTEFKAISTLSEAMKNQAYFFVLTSDIDLSAETTSDFIAFFQGGLDGNGHKIIGFSGDVQMNGYYSIIGDTLNDATIRDLTLVQNGTQFTTLVSSINRYSDRVGNVEFNNVDVEQKDPGAVVNCGNNDGPYCNFAFSGELKFIGCDNSADFNFATYGALYVGGYAHKAATVSFENCTNNGALTGANVALFVGNPSGGPATVTVTNCTNNGVVHGVTTEGWFSKLSNSTVYDALNSSVSVAGNPVGDSTATKVELAVKKNTDGTLTITAENAEAVSYYMVKARASSSFKKMSGDNEVSGGSAYVVLSERVEANENLVTSTPFGKYSLFVDESKVSGESVTFEDGRRESYVNARYTILDSGTVVFNSQDMMDAQASDGETMVSVSVNSAPTIIVEAYDASGVMVGELTVPFAQLAEAN